MRTLIYAAVAAAFAGVGPAIAGDGEGAVANSQFTLLPAVIAESLVQNTSSVASAQHVQGTSTFVTQTSPGIWLIPPYDGGGDNR